MDILKKYLDILMAVLVMVIFVTINYSQKQDVLTQCYLKIRTKEFVDTISVHGYLSIQMYETFLQDAGSVRIELRHKKNLWEPEYDNQVFLGTAMGYMEENYSDYIIEKLYTHGIYYFEMDDMIEVRLIGLTESAGMRYLNSMSGGKYTNEIQRIGRIRDVAKEGT